VRHPLRLYFRNVFVKDLRRITHSAAAAYYVTEQALQRRYPPHPDAFTTHFSDVGLKPECFVANSRKSKPASDPHRLLFVGTLEQLYKAPDVLIKAVAQCRRQGLNITLTIAGDGVMRSRLESLAKELAMSAAIHFAGHVTPRVAILNLLDNSDLFVLPSRAEGLPRAMLEAMARALPCIGSTASGIPELLAAEDIVPPGDVGALAKKIAEVAGDPGRMALMSSRNLQKAHEYEVEIMRCRKMNFMRNLRGASDRNTLPKQAVGVLI
jgi:glycosyltransferase involved in cell wall biosynthesis